MFFPYRDDNPARSFPFLTILIILVNCSLFILPAWRGNLAALVPEYGYTPEHFIFKPLSLFTSIFLHAGILHLVSNMWFLWLFGDNVEDDFGRTRYLALYLLSGVLGNLSHGLLTGFFTSQVSVIGASGAVAGVMGVYLVRYYQARINCVFFLVFYPVFFRIRALWFIGLWFLFEFFAAFSSSGDHVAHWAHVGGFLTGFLWALKKNELSLRRRRAEY